MPGSLTNGFLWSRWRENAPGIPGACATRNFAYLVRGPSRFPFRWNISQSHYCDAIMGTVTSQITSLTIVYTTVNSDADQSKHQSSASLAPHKWPVTRKMFPFDDVIMHSLNCVDPSCFMLKFAQSRRLSCNPWLSTVGCRWITSPALIYRSSQSRSQIHDKWPPFQDETQCMRSAEPALNLGHG